MHRSFRALNWSRQISSTGHIQNAHLNSNGASTVPNTLADRSPTATLRRHNARPSRVGPRIAAIATSDSRDVLSQEQVLERLGLKGNEFAEGIFARCGVKQRHLDLSEDFLEHTLQGRAQKIERDLMDHCIRAVDALELDTSHIGTVFSASLYSLGCPTLAHRLVDHYEMDPATDKYHVNGVACASAVPLMRLAAMAMREHPDRHALIVGAESMSGLLTRATPQDPRAKTVGSALFGDGCAAAVLSNDPQADGPMILASQVHQVPDTLGAVSLNLDGADGYLHLARELPDLAGAAMSEVVAGFLRRNRLEHSDIDHWIVHPGGRRIIESVQSALALSAEALATSWSALAEHGNVGTPSILYVLKDTIERYAPEPGERGLMVTIGPGITLGTMLLGW
jgi:predicted naringenin-chalcone synthase